MKNKILIITLICFIFLLSGCNNKTEKAYNEAKKNVTQEIKDTENISSDKISESLTYITNNYEDVRKASDNYQDIVQYAEYLEQISSKNETLKEHIVYKIGYSAKKYLKSFSTKDKKELESYLTQIERTETISKEFNNLYHQEITVKENNTKATNKIEKVFKEQNAVNQEKIQKAVSYINTNYENPQKNSEVSEKISYYAEYLNEIGTNSKCTNHVLVKLGTLTKNYLKDQNKNNQNKIKELLVTINKNQLYYINELNTLYNV